MFWGLVFVAVGARLLLVNGVRFGPKALWTIKSSLLIIAAGLFALFDVSPLKSTLGFCLQFPIFPIFAELSKPELSKAHQGVVFRYGPMVLISYWQIVGWMIQNFPKSGATLRKQIDDCVFVLMWLCIMVATRFSRFDVVKGVRGALDARNSVFFAAIPSLVLRFLPFPESFELAPYSATSVLFILFYAYSLNAVVVFLACAQADDQGYRAWWSLYGGVAPVVEWVELTPEGATPMVQRVSPARNPLVDRVKGQQAGKRRSFSNLISMEAIQSSSSPLAATKSK